MEMSIISADMDARRLERQAEATVIHATAVELEHVIGMMSRAHGVLAVIARKGKTIKNTKLTRPSF